MSKTRSKVRSKPASKGGLPRNLSRYLTTERIIVGGILILILAAVIFVIASQAPPPPAIDLSIADNSEAIPIMGREHIAVNQAHPPYNSNPPTSGPHYSNAFSPARAGVYTEILADETVIHNLEHGHVWFSYSDDDDQEAIDLLSEIQASFPREVIVTLRPQTPSRVAAAAWGRLLTVDGELNRDELQAFIQRYRNRAPERVPG